MSVDLEKRIQEVRSRIKKGLGFPGKESDGSDGKESVCNAGDVGSIPGLGKSSGEENGHSSSFAWRIPCTEEPGGLQSMRLQRVGHN